MPPPQLPRPRNDDPFRQFVRERGPRSFEARPYRLGDRFFLGTFRTYHDARRAVYKFFAGELKPLPKFVRPCRPDGTPARSGDGADGYIADVPAILLIHPFRSKPFDTPDAAGWAAQAHVASTTAKLAKIIGQDAAAALLAAFLKRG